MSKVCKCLAKEDVRYLPLANGKPAAAEEMSLKASITNKTC